MPVAPFTFGLESRPGRFGPDGGARLINAYAEQAAETAREPFPIYCVHGLDAFASLSGSAGCRGIQALGAVAYAIRGPVVNKVDGNGTASVIGGFPGSAPVFTARNAKADTPQIMAVSEGLKAIIEDDNLIEITDSDLPAPLSVFHIGGYFVAPVADGRFFLSELNEGLNWDALDFATAEASHDGNVAGIDRGQEAIIGGADSIEFWALTGNADFPFERVQGTTIQGLGLLEGSGHTLKRLNGVPFFVASDFTVRMLDGYAPVRVSHHDVERAIRQLADKSSLTATAYSIDGHGFYNLSSDEWTWTYDATYRRWFERKSKGLVRWRGECFVKLGDRLLVGDQGTGDLYQINPESHTENGNAIIWEMISGPVGLWPNRIEVNDLFLDLVPGVGLATGTGAHTDPEAMLQVSRDDAVTFGNERRAKVGKQGKRETRIHFPRIGTSGENGFRFRVSMSAAVSRGLTGAAIDAVQVDA